MSALRPTVVVMGILGRTPFAGVAWQVLHYLEGFRRRGCDVYYVEDTGDWPYDPVQNTVSDDPRYTVHYIARLLDWCGLAGRWAYRAASQGGRVYGMEESRLTELWRRADVLLNVVGGTVLRDEHRRVPVRIFLETDPGLAQIEIAQGQQFTTDLLAAHTHLFSYGENLGAPDCLVPLRQFPYHPTRQPVVLDWWAPLADFLAHAGAAGRFTTVTSWQQAGKDAVWGGETYLWSKHVEFLKFLDLPRRTAQPMGMALSCGDPDTRRLLAGHGWHLDDAFALTTDILPYRAYLFSARGEWTVAKDQYVRLRTGWFSDRSACFLAAGKPVITQDTAFGKFIPTGRGLFAFQTMDQVLDALDRINTAYAVHARAAREIAAEYFAAERVVADMLTRAGL
jgi:hypothetical protein